MLRAQCRLAEDSGPDAPRIALRSFCLALLNLNEFVYVD